MPKLRLNTVTLLGEVVSLENRSKAGTNKFVNIISLNVDDSYVNNNGELVSRSIPVEITYFKALPDGIKEGAIVVIAGKLSYSQWMSKDGSPRHKLGVVAVEPPQVVTSRSEDIEPDKSGDYPDDIPF